MLLPSFHISLCWLCLSKPLSLRPLEGASASAGFAQASLCPSVRLREPPSTRPSALLRARASLRLSAPRKPLLPLCSLEPPCPGNITGRLLCGLFFILVLPGFCWRSADSCGVYQNKIEATSITVVACGVKICVLDDCLVFL